MTSYCHIQGLNMPAHSHYVKRKRLLQRQSFHGWGTDIIWCPCPLSWCCWEWPPPADQVGNIYLVNCPLKCGFAVYSCLAYIYMVSLPKKLMSDSPKMLGMGSEWYTRAGAGHTEVWLGFPCKKQWDHSQDSIFQNWHSSVSYFVCCHTMLLRLPIERLNLCSLSFNGGGIQFMTHSWQQNSVEFRLELLYWKLKTSMSAVWLPWDQQTSK